MEFRKVSLLIVAVVGLLVATPGATPGAEAKYKGINKWCQTADYRSLCTAMVGGAATQDQAIEKAVQATIDVTNRVMPQLDAISKKFTTLPHDGLTKESGAVSLCTDDFAKALSNLNEAPSYLNADRYIVLDRLQAAESLFYECSTAIKEAGGLLTRPLQEPTGLLFRHATNCMAVATQR